MILRKRIITALTVTVLAAAVVVGAVGVPSIYAMKDLQGEINDAQAAIDERVAIFRYLRKAAADLETTENRVSVLSKTALQEGQELEFIQTMEGIAEEAGVKQDISLDMAAQKQLSTWERVVPLQLSVTGPYPAFRDYMTMMERLPYLVNVRSFSITGSSADGSAKSAVTANLAATVYWVSATGPSFTRPLNP